MVNISIGTALLTAILGYGVVFLGIVFLMLVVFLMGGLMKNSAASEIKNASTIVADGISPKKVAAIMAAIEETENGGKQ